MDWQHIFRLDHRINRHAFFWIAWILGFTFIKSFGQDLQVYLAWLFYYLLTLPIFMAHTYLIVYWAGRKLLKGWRILLLILVFIGALFIFSVLDLLASMHVVHALFGDIFPIEENYLDIGNIFISGIGNLYILLVFLAIKLIRKWYLVNQYRQDVMAKSLLIRRADVNAGIQPGMLLFSVKKMEELSKSIPELVAPSIASLSRILSQVMLLQKQEKIRVDEEVDITRRLLDLYAGLFKLPAPRLEIQGEEMALQKLCPFMLFTPVDIICRTSTELPFGPINIYMDTKGSLDIYWNNKQVKAATEYHDKIHDELEQLYPGRYSLSKKFEDGLEILHLEENQILM